MIGGIKLSLDMMEIQTIVNVDYVGKSIMSP